MKHIFNLGILTILFITVGCQRSKEADINGDKIADVIIKGNKVKDLIKGDNVLVIDGIVINAVTNDQWVYSGKELTLVKDKTFTMEYNYDTKSWDKKEL